MSRLCETCTTLDLDELFNGSGTLSGPGKTRSGVEASLGLITDVLDRKSRCDFCAIVSEKLEHEIHQDELKINYEDGTVEHQIHGKRSNADLQLTECALKFDYRWWSFMTSAGYFSDYAENWQDGGIPNNEQFPGRNTRECEVVMRVYREDRKHSSQKTLLSFNQLYDAVQPLNQQRLLERRIDPSKPDMSLMRTWIDTCLNEHGELCNTSDRLVPLYPERLRVIDVKKRCVILAPDECQYAALSYVWGGPQFVATQEDLQNLPFFLPEPPKLSQTVADAIDLCLELGLDYLWVDALCIIQVPYLNEDKADQVQQMDRIYRSALVTICAVSSISAMNGITGLGQRSPKQNVFKFKDKSYAERLPRIADVVDYELWNWRAWTYQERMLSRRKLTISEQQVFWQCQCDAWMESTVAEPIEPGAVGLLHRPKSSTHDLPEWEWGLRYTRAMPGVLSYGGGDSFIQTYQLVVSQYTARKIGEPRDGLNGITGILNVLSETRSGIEFIWGIPNALFDFALLWRPRSGASRSQIIQQEHSIPSWSWAAWFGEQSLGVEWDISDSGFGDPLTKPAVKWFLAQRDGSSRELRSGQSSSLDERKMVCGMSTKDVEDSPPLLLPSIVDKSDFYLHFQTTLAKFNIGAKLSWRDGTRDLLQWVPEHGRRYVENFVPDDPFELIDSNGFCIGHVVLTDEQRASFEISQATFAFLSYSREFGYNIVGSEQLKTIVAEKPKSTDWTILNCMLLVQREGLPIYERLALAKVSEAAWLAASLETRWVVLG